MQLIQAKMKDASTVHIRSLKCQLGDIANALAICSDEQLYIHKFERLHFLNQCRVADLLPVHLLKLLMAMARKRVDQSDH